MVKKLINIDDELFRKIQLKAINNRVPAQKIITDAIEQYFYEPVHNTMTVSKFVPLAADDSF